MKENLRLDSSTIASILGTVGSPLIVVSELIKNAIDASADKIDLVYDRETQSITVIDDGLGFTLEDIRQLSQPGFSGKKRSGNVTNAKGAFYTGSKGLGLLSVFSLCNHLTIQTKSDDGEYFINWSKDTGSYNYDEIVESQMQKGSIITLNNIPSEIMTLLTSDSEIKKLRHLSTYLYKHTSLTFPEITLSIDDSMPNSLLFKMDLSGMLFDVVFNYDNKTETLMFQCLSDNPQINNSEILINSFETSEIQHLLEKYFNIKQSIKTRTNDNVRFKELEGIQGVPAFEGRFLVYEKNTAGSMLKEFGAGVNIYTNDLAIYNYLSEELDWLGFADFSQRKKATRLKPHNVFGFVNMPHFDETIEKLKISNERADFIQDWVFVKLMYLLKGVIAYMIINIDVSYTKGKSSIAKNKHNVNNSNNNETGSGNKTEEQDAKTDSNEKNDISSKDASTNDTEAYKKDESLEENYQKNSQGTTNNSKSDNFDTSGDSDNRNNDKADDVEIEDEDQETYEPETVFKPQHKKRNHLTFTSAEGKLFDTLKNSNDLGNKIYQAIYELSKLNVLVYPYATVCLYRTLIESATQYASKKIGSDYQETALPASIKNVLNTWSNSSKTTKEFKSNVGLWRDLVNKRDLLDKLNLYIHNVTPVDVDLILDTWQSMKGYIRECIKC